MTPQAILKVAFIAKAPADRSDRQKILDLAQRLLRAQEPRVSGNQLRGNVIPISTGREWFSRDRLKD